MSAGIASGAEQSREWPAAPRILAADWTAIQWMDGDKVSTTRFFATWSGLRNPVKPGRRVDLIAAQKLEVYYAATFQLIGNTDLLVRFEKYRLEKRIVRVALPPALGSARLLAVDQWQGAAPQGLRAMQPAEMLSDGDYLFRHDGAARDEVTRIVRTLESRREYRYSSTGRYIDFVDHAGPRP